MSKIVQSASDAIAAIRTLNLELEQVPELAGRLGQAHAFYAIDEDKAEPLFGFSKFIGYQNLDAQTYLRDAKEKLTGTNTEYALGEWFEEVRYGTPQYKALLVKLANWLGRYGKRPRQGESQKARIMILKRECREESVPANDDKELLRLLIAVADRLPTSQRIELRNAL